MTTTPLTAIGKVDEVSKKAKSYKAVIGGHNYYCVNDLNPYVGQTISFEYKSSEPYDFKGKQVTSKFILFDTILIQGGVSTTPNIISKPKNPVSVPNSPIVAQPVTDWDSKEKRAIRGMCISYSKDLVLGGKIEVTELENMATSMVNYIYEKETPIPF